MVSCVRDHISLGGDLMLRPYKYLLLLRIFMETLHPACLLAIST